MASTREEMMKVIDYILNRSDRAEIEVIQKAIQRRLKDLSRGSSRLNIAGMAHSMSRAVESQMESKDKINKMIRGFIHDLLQRNQPDIPDEHIKMILDEYMPNEEMKEKGREDRLPRDAVLSMIVQFVDYSLGRMSSEEKSQLAPDWSRKYWDVFSGDTRRLIAHLLEGRIAESEFWEEIKKR